MQYAGPSPRAEGLTSLMIYTAVVTILCYVVLRYVALHCITVRNAVCFYMEFCSPLQSTSGWRLFPDISFINSQNSQHLQTVHTQLGLCIHLHSCNPILYDTLNISECIQSCYKHARSQTWETEQVWPTKRCPTRQHALICRPAQNWRMQSPRKLHRRVLLLQAAVIIYCRHPVTPLLQRSGIICCCVQCTAYGACLTMHCQWG